MSRFRTLLGSVSGLIVWAVHFAAVYSLVGVGCEQQWHRIPLMGTNRLTLLLIAVTLPALALIAWIGRRGWLSHRNAARGGAAREDSERWRFLSRVTLAIAVLAFLSTLMTSVPIMMLPPCN
jgi:hypothetical protein